jgi:hypothetical protein
MIYIFKGIQSICSLPGMLCTGCGELMGKLNLGPCKEVCVGCGDAVKHFFQRPLSTFVIFAVVMSALQGYSAYLVIGGETEDVKACEFKGPVDGTMYAGIQLVVAGVFLFFAPYFQRAVWKQIMDSVAQDPEPDADPSKAKYDIKDKKGPGMMAGLKGKLKQGSPEDPKEEEEEELMVSIKKETVQGAFKTVFLEDFFVLGIFIILCGNCVLSFMVECTCDWPPKPFATTLPKFMMASCATYTFFYYCCACCANKVEISKADLDELKGVQQVPTNDPLQ